MRLSMSGHRMRILAETVEEQIWQTECKIERLTQEWARMLGYGMPEQEMAERLRLARARLDELRSIRSDIRSQTKLYERTR